MKKIIAFLLSVLMITGLAACGDTSSHNEDFLDLKITKAELGEDWGTVENAIKGEYETVELNEPGAGLQALFDQLNDHNEKVRILVEDNMDRLEESLDGMNEANAKDMLPYYTNVYPYISRADDVLSYIELWTFFGGGSHSSSVFTANNYNAKTGQSLELSDVVTDVSAFQSEVFKKFDETHPGWEYTKPQTTDLWLIADGGIFVIWDCYELAPYSEGCQYVFMPFGEYSQLMSGGFFITPEGWMDKEINRYAEHSAYMLFSKEGDGWSSSSAGEGENTGLPELPYFDNTASGRMSNTVFGSCYCVDSKYDLYGQVIIGDTVGLWKNPSAREYEIIEEGVFPSNIQYIEELDAVWFLDPEDAHSLWSYDVKSGELTKKDVNCFTYSYDGGKIYYVDEGDFKLYSCNLSGQSKEKILDKHVADCFVYEGWAVYLDGTDSTIHAFDVENRVDYKLTECHSICPAVEGDTLYYVNMDNGNFLCSLNLKDGSEKIYEGIRTYGSYLLTPEYIYYYDAVHDGIACCVNREYMSTAGSETGFDTYMFIDGSLLWAEKYEYIFTTDSEDAAQDPYENYYRVQNYYDGDVSYWPINWELYGYDL